MASGAATSQSSRRLSRPSGETLFVLLLAGMWLIRGLLYALVNPHLESPDESAHLWYVTSLWREDIEEIQGEESEQPPLYYWLTLPLFSQAFERSEVLELLSVRVTSVLMVAGTVLFAYWTAKTLFPRDRFVYLGTAAFVALVPEFGYIGASANNDNLANLVSAGMIWLLVTAVSKGFSWYRVLGLLILIGLGVASKTTTWPVAIVVVLLLGASAILKLFPRRRVEALAAVSATLLVAGIAFLMSEFGRSILELKSDEGKGIFSPERIGTFLSNLDPWTFSYQFRTFWMTFRNDSIMLPDPFFWVLFTLSAIAGAGLVLRAARSVRSARGSGVGLESAGGDGIGLKWLVPVLLIVVQWFVVFARFYLDRPLSLAERAANAGWDPSISLLLGRFMFPVIVPIGLLFVWGLATFVPARWRRSAFLVLFAVLVCVDWMALGSLLFTYYSWET